ncbi:MAG: LPP20 family lipoprotein [Spirochaetes bacterium]|nr:LPP20 family lipoprotein [Spirochaetota bacterium]
MLRKKNIFLISILILIINSTFSITDDNLSKKVKKGRQPKWVKNLVAPEGFYVGVGQSGTLQDSYNSAVNIIAQQLRAKVQSEVQTQIDILVKNNERFVNQEFKKNIILNAKIDLEDVEAAEVWLSSKTGDYYTYCRLNIAKYEEKQRKIREDAKNYSFDLFKKANETGDPALSIKYNYLAFLKLAPYLTTIFEVNYQGNKINLIIEIISKLQEKMNSIEIAPVKESIIFEKLSSKPTLIKIKVTSDKNPLINFPLIFFDKENNLVLTDSASTDSEGVALCIISKAIKNIKLASFNTKLDIVSLIKEELKDDDIAKNMASLLNLGVSSKDIIVNIKLPIFRVAKIDIQGDLLSDQAYMLKVNNLAVSLKNLLIKKTGANFTEYKDADFTINMQFIGNFSQSSLSGGQYTRIIVNLSMVENKTGKEIYTDSSSEIKAGSENYLKALQNAIDKFNKEIGDEFIDKVVKFING